MSQRTPRPALDARYVPVGDAFRRDPSTGWTTLRVCLSAPEADGLMALIDEANMVPSEYFREMIRREIRLAHRNAKETYQ